MDLGTSGCEPGRVTAHSGRVSSGFSGFGWFEKFPIRGMLSLICGLLEIVLLEKIPEPACRRSLNRNDSTIWQRTT